jgi:hypothetical protein
MTAGDSAWRSRLPGGQPVKALNQIDVPIA